MNQALWSPPSSPAATQVMDRQRLHEEPPLGTLAESHSEVVSGGVSTFFRALPEIASNRNPFVAAVLGVALGLFGVSIYVRSWFDFLLFIAALGIILVAPPAIPIWALWLIWGVWGYLRVKYSRVRSRKPAMQVTNTAPAIDS